MKKHSDYSNFYISTHPLIIHKLNVLRNVETSNKLFREMTEELTLLLGYELSQDLPLVNKTITTPLTTTDMPFLTDDTPVIVPILRAGLAMVNPLLTLFPNARVGHIGLYRDEKTLEPKNYYFKIPKNCEDKLTIVCDPMLATGGSACDAITQLKKFGMKHIRMICLLASPIGAKRLAETHPDVMVNVACMDPKLNDKAYIVPGLGDAGDRYFGTV